MMDETALISGGIGAGAVGILSLIVLRYIVKSLVEAAVNQWITKYNELNAEVKNLRDEKFTNLQNMVETQFAEMPRKTQFVALQKRLEAVEKFNSDCPATELREALRNLVGWMKKNDLTLGDVRDKMNQLLAKEEATKIWIGNLDASHQNHVRDHSIHAVHRAGQ